MSVDCFTVLLQYSARCKHDCSIRVFQSFILWSGKVRLNSWRGVYGVPYHCYSMYMLSWILNNSGMELHKYLKFGALVASTLWPTKNIWKWSYSNVWYFYHHQLKFSLCTCYMEAIYVHLFFQAIPGYWGWQSAHMYLFFDHIIGIINHQQVGWNDILL